MLQTHSHATKDLSASFEKVKFLDADYALPYLGLALTAYKQVLSHSTNAIHNAWQVESNLDFDSFAKRLHTMRQLINFCGHTRFDASFLFVSSISTVSNFATVMDPSAEVPEQSFEE